MSADVGYFWAEGQLVRTFCGRAELAIEVGEHQTGGGCLAMTGTTEEGLFVVVTDNDGVGLPSDDDYFIGVYASIDAWGEGDQPLEEFRRLGGYRARRPRQSGG